MSSAGTLPPYPHAPYGAPSQGAIEPISSPCRKGMTLLMALIAFRFLRRREED
jgi:hypothetical protein